MSTSSSFVERMFTLWDIHWSDGASWRGLDEDHARECVANASRPGRVVRRDFTAKIPVILLAQEAAAKLGDRVVDEITGGRGLSGASPEQLRRLIEKAGL